MPSRTLKILCIHGVGRREADPKFTKLWSESILQALDPWASRVKPEIDFLAYDELFEEAELDVATVTEALARLSASALKHGILDLFGRRARGLGLSEKVRWTAGMLAQWSADEKLRSDLRDRLREKMSSFQPEMICAHSLGSLLSYDLFARERDLLAGRWYVSLGSQIGNPAVRSVFGGRIVALNARKWFHLYNSEDAMFTAEISLAEPGFEQVSAEFDISGVLDHDAGEYLRHANVADTVWRTIATEKEPASPVRRAKAAFLAEPRLSQKALLVGINDYPSEADRLEGCVNDVYLMSSVLQERGFPAESIRVVLDERATAKGILERLEWLLEGTGKEDVRFFYYSGHGSKIPAYGDTGEVDGRDECLVPHDFDWTREKAVTDDQFYEMYAQLPYDAHFLAVLDCCHSGGMTRDSGVRVRGLAPPDDIRHRELRWDGEEQVWVSRDLGPSRVKMLREGETPDLYLGKSAATRRLGRGVRLWSPEAQFSAARAAYDHKGPFMPILYQACQEDELSYEYRHGVTSYGAFTYCLTQLVRGEGRGRRRASSRRQLTFAELLNRTRAKLKKLQYDQTPTIVGPKSKIDQVVPFLGEAGGAPSRKARSG